MANPSIPVLDRQESSPKMGATPDFSGAFTNAAEADSNLSAIGSSVAQSASNQMAVQLGYEKGQTPTGDLAPPLTDFDKNFKDSYEQQAHATLSSQGDALLANAHVEMSKANRMTPELIAKTTQQLQMSLSKIAEQAPTNVQGKLKQQFDSSVLSMTTQYNEKMIAQNREDQTNILTNGVDVGIKNALEFAKAGDMKGAKAAADSAKRMADNMAANHLRTPEEVRVMKETADQTLLTGQYTFLAMQALKINQYPAFAKSYAENKPAGMTNEQWITTGEQFNKQVGFIQSLQTQNDNLLTQQMENRIAMDPNSITGSQWVQYENSVSPQKAAETQFKYIQAMKKGKTDDANDDFLTQHWSDPTVQANATPKQKDRVFNKQVAYTMQQSQQNGNPMTLEQAAVEVAASAGSEIPVFVRQLKNQLHSGNAQQIEAAATMIHALYGMQAGKAVASLNQEDHALYTAYEARKDSTDPVTAAHDATAVVLNQDNDVLLANKQKWANQLQKATQGGLSHNVWALQKFGLSNSSFFNPSLAQVYGGDILRNYETNFELLNGDDNSAQKMTQTYIDQNYGETGINGGSFTTLHPLEKVVGFQNKDCIPYIQQDVVNQMQPNFAKQKALYDSKRSNEYWEVMPVTGNKRGVISTSYDPIQVKRTQRTKDGIKATTFNVVLQGNAFSQWDVAVQTDSGMRNLFQVAPFLGVQSYTPNVQAIRENYMKDHALHTESYLAKTERITSETAKKFLENLPAIPKGHPNNTYWGVKNGA